MLAFCPHSVCGFLHCALNLDPKRGNIWTSVVCITKAIGQTSPSDERRLRLCPHARSSEYECQQLLAWNTGWMAHAALLNHAKLC